MSLTSWSAELCDALGLELEVDIDAILDLARDAAHQVERPAAPLTTFLVGYAAGCAGSAAAISDCVDIGTRLAASHGPVPPPLPTAELSGTRVPGHGVEWGL